MQNKRWMRRTAAVLSTALIVAACGGGDDVTEEPTDEATSEEMTEEEMTEEMTEEESEEAAVTDATDGSLQLAYILPETGQLAFLGPPMIGGTQLAVEDVNAAGGILGSEVTLGTGDEAGDATVASQTATRLLGQGVDAIIGAASSGMSLSFIDQVTGNGVLQCSPSNTSPTFTNYDDSGLYFRTAPTDALQGPVLANAIIGDGFSNPAILFRGDDYGRGLADAVVSTLEANGAGAAASIAYDPEAPNFSAEVDQALASGADSVVLISFDEAAQILTTMIENGAGPDAIAIYGADGMRSADLPGLVDPNNAGVIDGLKGTAPSSSPSPEFNARLLEATGGEDTLFAAEAYDCVALIALATQAAGSDEGTDIAAAMLEVSQGGTVCTTIADCLELLAAGEDIDYDGVSSNVDLIDAGEPAFGTYEVWEFGNGGEIATVSTEVSEL
jgi:branched-chain amino acid transport system substrate-binding protein